MSRKELFYNYSGSPDVVFSEVNRYLSSKKFYYTQVDSENVFRYGKGILLNSQFIKLSIYSDYIHLEYWQQLAMFPGVSIGEMSTVAGYTKSAVKKVEEILAYLGAVKGLPRQAVTLTVAVAPQQSHNPVCQSCRAPLQQGTAFCTQCGTPVSRPVQQNVQNIKLREYIDKYGSTTAKKEIKNIALFCYICLFISIVLTIVTGNWLGIIDIVILFGLTLGIHLGKSKVCAILLLIASIIEGVVGMVVSGGFTGYWWILASILVIRNFNKITKEYNQFKQNN